MSGYLVPFEAAETEFSEKRSRFLGRICRVESEDDARAIIEEEKKRYHDARHHCWSYLIREGGIIRYSDDGEPQGTAGQPILNVLQRQGITNVCCVVTRYFGGILLGAGGLTRAYGRSAEETLRAAGICRMSLWTRWDIPCTYPLLERVRLEIASCGGWERNPEYGAEILLHAAFPAGGAEKFTLRLRELSAGQFSMRAAGEEFLPGNREDAR